jgi:hypothetical protein
MAKSKRIVQDKKGGEIVENVENPDPNTGRLFRVHLAAVTPLEHNDIVLEAVSAADARKKFCEMNNIGGSDHAWTITEIDTETEGEAENADSVGESAD